MREYRTNQEQGDTVVLQAVDAAGYLYPVDVEPAQQQRGRPRRSTPAKMTHTGPHFAPARLRSLTSLTGSPLRPRPELAEVGPVPASLNSEVSRKGGNDNHVEAPKCR